jgi:hypothetical protein
MTTPWQPGVLYPGQKLEAASQIFAGVVTQQQVPHAGGTSPPKPVLVGANSGTGASVSALTGYDMAGNFTITAGTSPAAGTQCTVTFGRPLAAAPVAVNVTAADTSGNTNISFGASVMSKTGFSVYAGAAMTLNHVYLISYQVWQ